MVPHDDGQPASDYWAWNGQQWQPAHQDDSHFWDGRSWRPATALPRPSFWRPPWAAADTVRLVAWSVVTPAVLAVLILLGASIFELNADATVAVIGATYAGWAIACGATVRTRGRLIEQLLIAGAMVALLVFVASEWAISVDETRHGAHGQDIAGGLGAMLGIVMFLPPTFLLVALGRYAHKATSRRNRTAVQH